MARARNIKPSFFKNELLAEMEAFDRLLFIGLWCLADREGRIEDRPKRIKMELFPCDTYDVNAGLDQLAKHGFVRRYQAGGNAVVSIVNFHKHQTPHGTEKDSELPDETGSLTVHERSDNGYVTGKKRRNNVNSDQSTGQEQLSAGADTVQNQGKNTLNPESLILIPELNTEPNGSVGSADRLPRCDTQTVVDLYHEILPELPSVRLMNDQRRKAVSSLWKFALTSKKSDGSPRATTGPEAMEWVRGYFTRARDNDFLMGRGHKAAGHEGWQCDFDFLLSEKGKKHVIEKTQVHA